MEAAPQADPSLQRVLDTSLGLSILSVICDFNIIAGYIALRWYRKELVDRVSLRLMVVVSALDLWLQAHQIFSYSQNDSRATCGLFATLNTFVPHLYYSFNLAISFNLCLAVLGKKSYSIRWEQFYYFFVISTAIGTSIPVLSRFELISKGSRKCYLNAFNLDNSQNMYFVTDGIWFILNFVLGLCSALLIYSKIVRPDPVDKLIAINHTDLSISRANLYVNDVRGLIFRIALYPLVPIATQTFMLLFTVNSRANEHPSAFLEAAANVLSSLTGLINLLLLISDPTIVSALREVRYDCFRSSISPGSRKRRENPGLTLPEIGRTSSDSCTIHEDLSQSLGFYDPRQKLPEEFRLLVSSI